MQKLVAVPNVSEGRDRAKIDAVGAAFQSAGAALLDVHSDADHNRTVYSLAGEPDALLDGLCAGAATVVAEVDMQSYDGLHPAIGALDVAPIVYPGQETCDAARALATQLANRLANELGLPIFFYGELASDASRHERSFFRRGGTSELRRRMGEERLMPDMGPTEPHPSAVATLVTARPPLIAFNVELDCNDLELARRIADRLRRWEKGGAGGLRAIGLRLEKGGGWAQVSINVGSPHRLRLAEIVDFIFLLAKEAGVSLRCAEIVGLVPEASLLGLPTDLEIRGFDRSRQLLERRLAAH